MKTQHGFVHFLSNSQEISQSGVEIFLCLFDLDPTQNKSKPLTTHPPPQQHPTQQSPIIMARQTRQSSRSSNSVDSLFSTDHLHTEEQEFLAEQALLELIAGQSSPSQSSSPRRRRSRRSSARTPAYDPQRPSQAVREASIPYDTAAWEAISLANDVRRPSFSPLTSRGSSARTTLYSPGRTPSQRHSLEYDPRTPLFELGARPPAGVLYDPAKIQYHRSSSSAALGTERSPEYSPYGYGTESGGDDESAQDNTIAQQIENAVQRALREVLPSLLREELEGWMLERLRGVVASGARSQPVSPSALKAASRRASSASRSGALKKVSFEEVRGEVGDVSWGPRKRERKVLSSEGVSPTGIPRSRLTASFLEAASSPEKSPKETSSRVAKTGKQSIASARTSRSSRTQMTSRGGKVAVAKVSKKLVAPRKKAAARSAPKSAASSKLEAPRRSVRVREKLQGAVSKAG